MMMNFLLEGACRGTRGHPLGAARDEEPRAPTGRQRLSPGLRKALSVLLLSATLCAAGAAPVRAAAPLVVAITEYAGVTIATASALDALSKAIDNVHSVFANILAERHAKRARRRSRRW